MRLCLKCNNEMQENLEISVSNGAFGIEVRKKGLFSSSLGRIKCAVCPTCGYVETYVEDTEKLKKMFAEKQ